MVFWVVLKRYLNRPSVFILDVHMTNVVSSVSGKLHSGKRRTIVVALPKIQNERYGREGDGAWWKAEKKNSTHWNDGLGARYGPVKENPVERGYKCEKMDSTKSSHPYTHALLCQLQPNATEPLLANLIQRERCREQKPKNYNSSYPPSIQAEVQELNLKKIRPSTLVYILIPIPSDEGEYNGAQPHDLSRFWMDEKIETFPSPPIISFHHLPPANSTNSDDGICSLVCENRKWKLFSVRMEVFQLDH